MILNIVDEQIVHSHITFTINNVVVCNTKAYKVNRKLLTLIGGRGILIIPSRGIGVNMGCCCEEKKTYRSEEEKKKLITRLNRIEGQIRGIKKMIEDDSYCIDILTQCSAAQSAFSSFSRELLSTHISGCFVRGVKEGDDKVIEELSSVLEKLVK